MTFDLEQALFLAIADEPADETPWLILADWLEEQGDSRADLVRLQQQLRGEMADELREDLEAQVRDPLVRGVRPCVPVVVNSIGMPLALVRPGSFWMGSPVQEPGRYVDEDPRHRVEITRPFYLGVYQVTQEQYQQVMGNNPSYFSPHGHGANLVRGIDCDNLPVDSVTWFDAVNFCARLSNLPPEKAAGRVYRLPTEAEWEYACRGGSSSQAPFHFGYSLSSWQANFDGTRPYGSGRRGPNLRRTSPVGSYPPNGFGLYDMHGNVWEWCSDWFDVEYYHHSPECDPSGPDQGESRILRGGSFYYIGASCRSAIRFGRRPDARSNLDGFRVAMDVRRGHRITACSR